MKALAQQLVDRVSDRCHLGIPLRAGEPARPPKESVEALDLFIAKSGRALIERSGRDVVGRLLVVRAVQYLIHQRLRVNSLAVLARFSPGVPLPPRPQHGLRCGRAGEQASENRCCRPVTNTPLLLARRGACGYKLLAIRPNVLIETGVFRCHRVGALRRLALGERRLLAQPALKVGTLPLNESTRHAIPGQRFGLRTV